MTQLTLSRSRGAEGSLSERRRHGEHTSVRTTQLYDRPQEEVNLDEVERISI